MDANVRRELNRVGKVLATPRFHHLGYGIDKEAIEVNFSIHLPLFHRRFSSYHLPKHQWPEAYGIQGHPVPRSYLGQFLYPFRRKDNA